MRFGTRSMTKAERAAFVNVGGQQAWQAFRSRLDGANTLAEARDVARLGPGAASAGASSAGSILYANLGNFLQGLQASAKAGPGERVLYAGLVRRMERNGELTLAEANRIILGLRMS